MPLAMVLELPLALSAIVGAGVLLAARRGRVRRLLEMERARLAAVIEQMPAGVVVADAPSGRLVLGNQHLVTLFGRPWLRSPDVAAYAEWAGHHPDGRRYTASEWPLARAITHGETVTGEEIAIVRGDGTPAILRVNARPIREPAGRIVGGVAVAEDVTEVRRAADDAARTARRFAELQAATAALGAALTVDEIALRVVGQVSALLGAAAGALSVVEPDGQTIRVVRMVGYSPQADADWADRRLLLDRGTPITDVARTGAPVYLRDRAAWGASYPTFAPTHFALGYEGAAVLPCVLAGRVLGVISLSFHGPCGIELAEGSLALTVATQCAQALHRVQLLDEQRRARAEAEAAAQRTARLQHVTACISGAISVADVAQIAAEEIAGAAHAAASAVYLIGTDGTTLERVARWPRMHARGARLPRSLAAARGAMHGELLVRGRTTRSGRPWAAVPLRAGRAALGVVVLAFPADADLASEDESLLVATGQILAQGITRARLQTMHESDRRRLSREVHDELGQVLTGLKLDLAWLGRELASAAPALVVETSRMARHVDASVATVRRIAADLRPAVLDDLGLGAALEWHATEFAMRTRVACTVAVAVDDAALDDETAITVFRVLQESLTNVARHASATHVHASLRARSGALVFQVSDDGCGFDPRGVSGSGALGIAGMRERASLLGGELTVRSRRGRGTTVTLRLPVCVQGTATCPDGAAPTTERGIAR